jgi:ATP-dependent Clp protease ATP-binding subunit ClpC
LDPGVATILTVLLGVAIYWAVRRIAPAPSPVAQEEPASGRSLYDIAGLLTPIYQGCARPDDLAATPDFREGVALLSSPAYVAGDLADYFCGENAIIAMLAAAALAERDDSLPARERVTTYIGTVAVWPLHFALVYLARRVPADDPIVGIVLSRTTGYLYDRQAQLSLREFVEKRLRGGEQPVFADDRGPLNDSMLAPLWTFIDGLEPDLADPLRRALQCWCDSHIDRAFLMSFGLIWDARRIGSADSIVAHPAFDAATDRAIEALTGTPARSILLVGEPGTGKSTLARRIAQLLSDEGWIIFQAGHSQLIAGQSYIGQIEERLTRLIAQLGGQRRILWIVPSFHELAYSGRHQYAQVGALDTILGPAQRGDIKILGLCTPGTHERLARQLPGLETALVPVKLTPATPDAARAMAGEWLIRLGVDRPAAEQLTAEAAELAQQFLTGDAAPGNLFGLLKLALARVSDDAGPGGLAISTDDLIETLAEITGLPVGLLDDRARIDIEGLRRRFNERVLGQPEAVDCLVERVAMMKAGLADPLRPVGVFLFAGPTGTGKTEMAKTLAEWLFGSAGRLVRVDMSELQTPDDLERLIGSGASGGGDSLAARVREQPFSVVLLDEFEKAHARVWDLFLQVFDDGRLTDRAGHTADFRHSIIILTSNLGSAVPTGVSLGFRAADRGFDPAFVMRAVEQSFRREFVNRLDRVIVFRPLTRELMRQILEKELADVLKRRGLRSKPWAVEWEPAAIDFLLEQGFTPDLGARPLRRAMERFFLSPLALTIVGHEAPEGDQFLFVTRNGERLEVQFVDPDAADAVAGESAAGGGLPVPESRTLAAIALDPGGAPAEVELLRGRCRELEAAIAGEEWQRGHDADMELMKDPGFWTAQERWAVLDRLELRDRIGHALRRAASLAARLDRLAAPHRRQFPRDPVQNLARSLHLIAIAIDDIAQSRPSDAFILVAPGRGEETTEQQAEAFARELAGMYRSWAKRRRMELMELDVSAGPDGGARPGLFAVVRGFAAHSILAGEQGLHVLETGERRDRAAQRVTVTVTVAPEIATAEPASGAILARRARDALAASKDRTPRIVRRYRKAPSPLVRDGVKGWRTGRIDQVLGGDFDLIG